MCTVNKKQEFKNLLEIFNSQYSKDIFFIYRVIKPSLTTGWLSGYIDALGSFIGLTENKELNAPYKTLYLTFSRLRAPKVSVFPFLGGEAASYFLFFFKKNKKLVFFSWPWQGSRKKTRRSRGEADTHSLNELER